MKSTIVATCLALVAGVAIGRATIASSFDMAPTKPVSVSPGMASARTIRSIAAAAEASSELGYGKSGITDWTRNFFWQ